MRVLFITARLPLPNTKGDSLRSFYLLRDLAKDNEVDVISFIENKKEREQAAELEKHCHSVKTVLLPRVWALFKMILGLFSLTPFQVIYYSSLRMHMVIRNAVAKGQYDLVHVTPVRMMSYSSCMKRLPLVVDLVDALSMNMRRRAHREKNFLKKLLFHFESWKMARYEAWVTKQYDYGTITSDVDRRAIRGNHIEVVPNGVDTSRFQAKEQIGDKEIDAIFTGNMNYFPNVDAAVKYKKEIFPEVNKERSGSNFFIVGANPAKNIKELGDDVSTFVTGFVPDINDYLNKAKVFVAPLSVGSGIQNKILEAMACGVPVVSTSRGNAAIEAQNDESILIADTNRDFATKVVSLLNNPEYRKTIGQKGKDHVQQNFGWGRQAKKLQSTYQKAIHLHEMKEYEQSTGRVPIYYYDKTKANVENNGSFGKSVWMTFSRLFDTLLATVGLFLSFPLWIAAIIGIKLTDRGPVFYRQDRVGLNGESFNLIKFRTMVTNAEKAGKPQFCKANDCRITRFGHFMRKTRIDELPQLINVLKGDMGLIGPRPERPEFVDGFEKDIPFYGNRHMVKPGVTGWAQVNFPYASTVEDTIRKLQYDLYYIKNRSVAMDLSILFQTVSVVLTGKGAR